MDAIKTTNNLEFDVIYGDGTRKHVEEGVMIEAQGKNLILHWGSNRRVLLYASIEVLLETIEELGLSEECNRYLFGEREDNNNGKSDV